MRVRWLVGILVAAGAGSLAYAVGFGSEVVYIIRTVVRHLAGYGL
jgi:hypothetical protein